MTTPASSSSSSAAAAARSVAASSEYLSFRLGTVEYGIEILKVQEIRAYETPTHIANAPPSLKGVMQLRGTIVPIVDLRVKLGLEQVGFDHLTVTVILSLEKGPVGVVVDAVSDVVDLLPSQISAAPDFDDTVDASHMTGIGTLRTEDSERMLILVDIERWMTHVHAVVPSQTLQ